MGTKSTKDLKKENTLRIIESVNKKNKLSRTEISEITTLAPSTVSIIVSELLEKGLLADVGEASSTGGRPRKMLQFSRTAGYHLVFVIEYSQIKINIYNLRLEVIKSEILFDRRIRGKQLVSLIEDSIASSIKEYGSKGLHSLIVLAAKDIPEYELNVEYSTVLSIDVLTIDVLLRSKYNFPVFSTTMSSIQILDLSQESHLYKASKEFIHIVIGEASLNYKYVNELQNGNVIDYFNSIKYEDFSGLYESSLDSLSKVYDKFLETCRIVFGVTCIFVDDHLELLQQEMSHHDIINHEDLEITLLMKEPIKDEVNYYVNGIIMNNADAIFNRWL